MGRKPKTVKIAEVESATKIIEVEETKPATKSTELEELEGTLRTNGLAGLEGFEDLIVEVYPDARANNNVKYPIKVADKEVSILEIIEKLEGHAPYASECLYKIYKRHANRAGATIYLRLRILELETEEGELP